MAESKLTPLQDSVVIVNPNGTPTPYLIQLFQQLLEEKEATDVLAEAAAPSTRQILAGAGLSGGGDLTADVTLSANVQAILNLVTTTRGSILYRGAAVWSALVPGTTGYVLTSGGTGADPIWAAGGASIDWGDIGGTLGDQVDLQAALDGKLSVIDDSLDWGPGALAVSPAPVFSIGYAQVEGAIAMLPAPDPDDVPIIYLAGFGYFGTGWLGSRNANDRIAIGCDGFLTGWEFNLTPYVNDDPIYHGGNLAFGSGLDYTAGVLATTGSSGVLPVVDGSIPPVFLQNPDGSLIYTPI